MVSGVGKGRGAGESVELDSDVGGEWGGEGAGVEDGWGIMGGYVM